MFRSSLTSSRMLFRLSLVLHPAVELGEHLVGVVDRGDRLVRAGVDHARPGVGAVGHHHAEFERAEPGAGRRRLFCRKFLISWSIEMPLGPAGRRVASRPGCCPGRARSGEQAADAAHVVVAVAADLVADAVEDQRPVLERLERLEALLERERRRLPRRARTPTGSTPLGLNMTTSRCFRRCLVGEAEAGQVEDERQRRRADAQVADELAAAASVGHLPRLRKATGWRVGGQRKCRTVAERTGRPD